MWHKAIFTNKRCNQLTLTAWCIGASKRLRLINSHFCYITISAFRFEAEHENARSVRHNCTAHAEKMECENEKKTLKSENDGQWTCHKLQLTNEDHRVDACASRHIIKSTFWVGF